MKRSISSLFVAAALLSSSAIASNSWEDSAKDAWIDGKAEATLLLNGNLNSFDINTDVKNGTVTLTGKVDREVDKALAEELVLNLDGVKDVENMLSVVEEASKDADESVSQSLRDSKIETVVKTRLLWESEVRGLDIEVEVDKGVVTLSGSVESDAARDLAVTLAKNTNDVEDVVSKLKVRNS
ncbi:MAG: BON domain-containing protein [Aliiglaciecola sp.]